jgi:hypothetical protein
MLFYASWAVLELEILLPQLPVLGLQVYTTTLH